MATKKPAPHAFGKKDPLKRIRKQIRKQISEEQFEGLTNAVKTAWKKDEDCALELGDALTALRNAFYVHGAFTKWLRANGIDQNRASYAMRKAAGKVREAKVKHAQLPQSKAKSRIDYLFNIIKQPFEPRALAEASYEVVANMFTVQGVVRQTAQQYGWQLGKDIRPHTDPKWVAVSKDLQHALMNMWATLLFANEPLEVETPKQPALLPARERAEARTMKRRSAPKLKSRAAAAGAGFAP